MTLQDRKTATYKIITDSGGKRVQFFCDLSGMMVCESGCIEAESDGDVLDEAWLRVGRDNFNKCQKCGRWVSDLMYNADVLWCVDCAPWENRPKFCHKCGIEVSSDDTFCRKCGARLRYSEVFHDAG